MSEEESKLRKSIKTGNMKKIWILFAAVAMMAAAACARDTYAHDASVLPKAAQTVIANNFKSKVSVVKIDKDFGRVSEYEVILSELNNWDNVETSNTSSVPKAFIPQGIRDFVSKNHSGARIVGIDKERSGYDVELSNGIEMKFNKAGQFLRYDD